jgi:carboxypeptidase Taq
VRPSLVRVEADEVTYNLHIILRFELEIALLRGEIAVEDLPNAWNEKMKKMFHLTPQNDGEGVLQDVHWSAGLIGYFPTYALGNVYAAQLFAAAKSTLPDLDDQFQKGHFDDLLTWLRKHVHALGSTYQPGELIQFATGETPTPSHLINYLEKKFTELYGL